MEAPDLSDKFVRGGFLRVFGLLCRYSEAKYLKNFKVFYWLPG